MGEGARFALMLIPFVKPSSIPAKEAAPVEEGGLAEVEGLCCLRFLPTAHMIPPEAGRLQGSHRHRPHYQLPILLFVHLRERLERIVQQDMEKLLLDAIDREALVHGGHTAHRAAGDRAKDSHRRCRDAAQQGCVHGFASRETWHATCFA